MTEEEKIAIGFIPKNLSESVIRAVSVWNCPVSEIRLRENRRLSVTVGGKNVICSEICSSDDIGTTISRICKGSLYSHSDSIRDGVIATEYGIRVGVSGRAVMNGDWIECVRDICSVNIRIPHRVAGAADEVFRLVKKYGSILIYSLPGKGKTTILRELIPLLASGESAARVSVIDSRYELVSGVDEGDLTDVYFGYPRELGIIQSVRTMSPEYIICDEIASSADSDAILCAHSAGVCVIATAHAADMDGLMKNECIARLVNNGVFGYIFGVGESEK